MAALDPDKIARYRQLLREEETPEPEPITREELHDVWTKGNESAPVGPKHSDNYKANLVDLEQRWIRFCAKIGKSDWEAEIKTRSSENKGLGKAFLCYFMREAELRNGRSVTSENAVVVPTRRLGSLYHKYTGKK